MILKSIKLKNFRQFIDSQLTFSTDKEKNVTLILARNKTGKTTLTNAFTWCLFGKTNFKKNTNVINRKVQHELKSYKDAEVSVEIELQYANQEYCIKRVQTFTKNHTLYGKEKIDANPTKLYITYKDPETGLTKGIDENKVQEKLDSIIPKDLSDYLFMRAEQIETMSQAFQTNDSDENFSSAVKKILGMQPLEEAIKHLYEQSNNSTYALFQKDYKSDSGSQIDKISNNIFNINSDINKNKEFLKRAEEATPKLIARIGELTSIINKWAKGKEQQDELNKKATNLSASETSLDITKTKYLEDFARALPTFCLKNIVPEVIPLLKETKVEEKYVPDITEKTIKALIKREKCICGADCKIGTDAHKALVDLLDYIPPKSIGSIISEYLKEARYYTNQDNFVDLNEAHQAFKKDMLRIQSQIDDLTDEINKLQKDLKENKDTSKYEEEKEEKQRALSELNNAVTSKKAENINLGKEIETLERKLSNLSAADSNNQQVDNFKRHTKAIYEALKKSLKEREEVLRKLMIEKMNEIFSSVFTKNYRINLNEKYKLSITDIYENGEDIDTSGAQSVYILLAFITSVLYLARPTNVASQLQDNDELLSTEAYPLVLDAPFSSFDEDIIPNICEKLPELTEQIIIFSKYIDGKLIKEHMQKRIGKFYTMRAATLLDNNEDDVLETKVEEGDINVATI